MTSTDMQPARFRKKPVVIEAMQFDGTPECAEVISRWAARHGKAVWIEYERTLTIQTPGGSMRANLGDWIICNAQGEIWPIKPNTFESTYEEVDA